MTVNLEPPNKDMKIKVCGMRNPNNICAVAALGIDMIGLVFIKNSPCYVSMINSLSGIVPDFCEDSLAGKVQHKSHVQHGKSVEKVGVFADDMPQNIVMRVYKFHLDYVQLNGEESAIMIDNLLHTLKPDIQPNIKIIKKIKIRKPSDFDICNSYEGLINLFLFEPDTEDYVDVNLLKKYQGNIPFLLGGNMENSLLYINDLKKIDKFAGLNISTGFETEPGIKNVEKLKKFLLKI